MVHGVSGWCIEAQCERIQKIRSELLPVSTHGTAPPLPCHYAVTILSSSAQQVLYKFYSRSVLIRCFYQLSCISAKHGSDMMPSLGLLYGQAVQYNTCMQ